MKKQGLKRKLNPPDPKNPPDAKKRQGDQEIHFCYPQNSPYRKNPPPSGGDRPPPGGTPVLLRGGRARGVPKSKSVPRNFLVFGTKFGPLNATEVKFLDFPEKSCLSFFDPIWSEKCNFWPKISVSANFLKIWS